MTPTDAPNQRLQPDLFLGTPDRDPVVVAWGGGTDSSAMIIEMITRNNPIDLVLIADTGDEHPRFYTYVPLFMAYLERQNIPVAMVRYAPKNFKNWPPYATLSENCLTNQTLPSVAFGFSSCSQKWKAEPQDRYLKSWEPGVRAWAAGRSVQKLIGYDCSTRDTQRFQAAQKIHDPRYTYRYPLQEWGWTREQCTDRLQRSLHEIPMLPGKSSCWMCTAVKPEELHDDPPWILRRIVLMEARAAPRLRNCDGLWRKPIKGTRTGRPRPGSMTAYIRAQGLLPAAEIDAIIACAPTALSRWQDSVADLPIDQRPGISEWLRLFDTLDPTAFDDPAGNNIFLPSIPRPVAA